MMEYTMAIILAFLAIIVLDRVLKTKLLPPSRRLCACMAIFALAQLIFDNFFTRMGVWRFNSSEVIGIWLPFIPLENMLFGQALLLFTLILYTRFQRTH